MGTPVFCAIVKLEHHWVGNVKPGKLVQRTRGHYDLSAVVHIFSFWARQHHNRIAAVVFIEAASTSTGAGHTSAQDTVHRVV